jgi:hypothetical protein
MATKPAQKTQMLFFRALPEEIEMADALALELQCNRSEALRRLLWAACKKQFRMPIVDMERVKDNGNL